MADHPGIAELYLDAQRSFVALARTLEPEHWRTSVACCPGWTARDVLSHVAGLSDDVLAGRVEGAATEPWTAAQVERWKDTAVDHLLAQWDEQAPRTAQALEAVGELRPPFDCCAHEHDIRAALGRPGVRDAPAVTAGARLFRQGLPMEIPRSLSDFEVFRSRLGRRSRTQVLAYDWPAPPDDAQLDAWFAFGPSEVDIVE